MLREALRYLGIQGEADEQTLRLVSDCMENIKSISVPRHITKSFLPDDFQPFIVGEDIKKHLCEAKEIVLMAATLGVEVDRAIKKAQATDMARAAMLNACAAAYIEEYCDTVMPDGLPSARRFSPGYGDYPLSMQSRFLKILHAEKIGVSALESHMLVPSKSVTAVIGTGQEKIKIGHKCANCNKKDCAFRTEDKNEA